MANNLKRNIKTNLRMIKFNQKALNLQKNNKMQIDKALTQIKCSENMDSKEILLKPKKFQLLQKIKIKAKEKLLNYPMYAKTNKTKNNSLIIHRKVKKTLMCEKFE